MELLTPSFGFLFFIALILLNFGLLVTSLIMLLRNKKLDSITKLLWTIIIIFVPVIGSVLYFVLGGKHNAGNAVS